MFTPLQLVTKTLLPFLFISISHIHSYILQVLYILIISYVVKLLIHIARIVIIFKHFPILSKFHLIDLQSFINNLTLNGLLITIL
jgi:hypothetical protein